MQQNKEPPTAVSAARPHGSRCSPRTGEQLAKAAAACVLHRGCGECGIFLSRGYCSHAASGGRSPPRPARPRGAERSPAGGKGHPDSATSPSDDLCINQLM